jgi:hypothetical protein
MMPKQLNISKNILPKIPQFWETPSAAFAELVQNAFRAGATEIHLQGDVVGINAMEKTLILGECQWTRTPNHRKALIQLVEEKAGKIIPRQGNWHVFLVGFSRAGWTSAALAYQEQINPQPPAGKNWKVSGLRLVNSNSLTRICKSGPIDRRR